MVSDSVLKYSLEHQGQFFGRTVAVFFGEAHHRVLHDVQCGVVATHCEGRLFEGAAFDVRQKIRKFFWGSQGACSSLFQEFRIKAADTSNQYRNPLNFTGSLMKILSSGR